MNSKETAVTNSKQDNLVQYPLPYKVVDGCLYKEITNKSGITSKNSVTFCRTLSARSVLTTERK